MYGTHVMNGMHGIYGMYGSRYGLFIEAILYSECVISNGYIPIILTQNAYDTE